ncbi:MAG: hypothetical protein CMD02_05230 [Flavobacteriales bacterium]|nr:hypothetical protein [Flavobacteriales bacterium]|tara:strand:- start:5515 stop:5937 length:423 start_codon:yes stop_codon:yes gene_type:complete
MKKLTLIALFILSKASHSQVISGKISEINHSKIEINYEEGIKELMEKHKQINKLNNGIKGFCVQIYLGDNREKAQKTKYNFMKKFPEIKSVQYERISPNWKVKVGKLRTKLEAEKLKSIINSEYPNCFITEIIVPLGGFD